LRQWKKKRQLRDVRTEGEKYAMKKRLRGRLGNEGGQRLN
jgi:hypothetical protein